MKITLEHQGATVCRVTTQDDPPGECLLAAVQILAAVMATIDSEERLETLTIDRELFFRLADKEADFFQCDRPDSFWLNGVTLQPEPAP